MEHKGNIRSGGFKELSIEQIRANIERMKHRRATDPNFGKRRPKKVKEKKDKEKKVEDELFKLWLKERQDAGEMEEETEKDEEE